MKEQLYTIPLNDAVNANDECPFCFIERKIEQDTMDFVLGNASSYMEADIRDMTDREGFCRTHFKRMFDYGNTLGNAWILKTHYMRILREMHSRFADFAPGKASLKDRFRKAAAEGNAIASWVTEKEKSCYICNRFDEVYTRYLDTFFYMFRHDEDFKEKVVNGKGFCLLHFRDMCLAADRTLGDKEKEEFYRVMLPLMERNMERISEDVAWMVEKFDYQNAGADWKNSRDAIQRGMQKLKGGYPGDGVYKMSK
jgi:hypothetical protein